MLSRVEVVDFPRVATLSENRPDSREVKQKEGEEDRE